MAPRKSSRKGKEIVPTPRTIPPGGRVLPNLLNLAQPPQRAKSQSSEVKYLDWPTWSEHSLNPSVQKVEVGPGGPDEQKIHLGPESQNNIQESPRTPTVIRGPEASESYLAPEVT